MPKTKAKTADTPAAAPTGVPTPVLGTGMPSHMHLDLFGSLVWDAFGDPPYLVGTAAVSKQWRDVDVRLILEDAQYDEMFGTGPRSHGSHNGKWAALCMAFSALGKQMTGLPIDFQIQRQTQANEYYAGKPRNALGLISLRLDPFKEDE